MAWIIYIYTSQNNLMGQGLLLSFYYTNEQSELLQVEICVYFHSIKS